MSIEIAKKILEKYKLKHQPMYRGISVSEFDKEELLKIIDQYAELVVIKDKTIDALSLRVF